MCSHDIQKKSIRSKTNSYLEKKLTIGNKIEPLSFQKARPKDGQLGVTLLEHLVMPFGVRKC
jgi:hypothetical protein